MNAVKLPGCCKKKLPNPVSPNPISNPSEIPVGSLVEIQLPGTVGGAFNVAEVRRGSAAVDSGSDLCLASVFVSGKQSVPVRLKHRSLAVPPPDQSDAAHGAPIYVPKHSERASASAPSAIARRFSEHNLTGSSFKQAHPFTRSNL